MAMQISESLQKLRGKNSTKKTKPKQKKQNSAHLQNLLTEEFP